MTTTSKGRRKLLGALGATGVAVTTEWAKPVVEAVVVPLTANASPPPPVRVCPVVAYSGPASVTLPNSSGATELAWVRQNIDASLSALGKIEPGGMSWVATIAYSVVLIKAGREHYVFTNVREGQRLTVPKGISHVSRFVCP